MPKQPAKTTRQSAKYREQQLRRRMAAQERVGEDFDYDAAETDAAELDESVTTAVTYTPMSSAAAAAARRPVAAPTMPRPAAPRPLTTPRRTVGTGTGTSAVSAARASRGRLAAQVQSLNLDDEMAYVRSDIRRLLILASAALVILIVLAVFLNLS